MSDKKLWEEAWSPDDVIVLHNRHDGQKEAREVLAHAAPSLALALKRLGGAAWHKDRLEWHLETCWRNLDAGVPECLVECQAARAALVKAGVPLP